MYNILTFGMHNIICFTKMIQNYQYYMYLSKVSLKVRRLRWSGLQEVDDR